MLQPSDSEKELLLTQILRSPDFQDSKRYRDLLRYLVERTSSEESLKEIQIAQDVFGKASDFDPATDPLIRSYVSNLRKKLEHYYLTTEDHYRFEVVVPKGHYLVRYLPASRRQGSHVGRRRRDLAYLSVIAVLLVAVVIFAVRELRSPTSIEESRNGALPGALWTEFVQPNARPTLIVLGDFFFMRERGNSDGYYRKGKINTIDEFLDYVGKNPEVGRQFTRSNVTFLRPSAAWGLLHLLPTLRSASSGVTLKLASQFTSDDFKSHNVVFIGSFKTLHVLKNFLKTFQLDYSTVPPSSFSIRDGIGDSIQTFRPEVLSAGSLEKDYGVIAKGQGPDGSCLLLLMGFSEGGVIQAAQAASDPALIETVAARYPPGTKVDPAALTLVIGAEGMTQSLYDPIVKYLVGAGHPTVTRTPQQKDSSRVREGQLR